jgi:hypothetical protein
MSIMSILLLTVAVLVLGYLIHALLSPGICPQPVRNGGNASRTGGQKRSPIASSLRSETQLAGPDREKRAGFRPSGGGR